jgi:phosphoglycolate phosphatase-like HAD superfamily hydrolase
MLTARPAAVLFDMDGLLLDTERLIRDAMIAVMADFGFAMSRADYAELIGRPEPASRAIMQGRFGALLDYDVMRAEVRQRVGDGRGDHGVVAYIAGYGQATNVACHGLCPFELQVAHDDLGALRGKGTRRGRSDTGCATGDEHDMIGEFRHKCERKG